MTTTKILVCIPVLCLLCTSSFALVAIDVGHQLGKDPGCISASGVPEVVYNRRVSQGIKAKLEQAGVKCFLILDEPTRNRAEIATQKGSTVLVSIHHDSVRKSLLPYVYRYRGFSIFVSRNNGSFYDSLMLAHFVGREMTSRDFVPALHYTRTFTTHSQSYGIFQNDKLVVLKTECPSILIECGIIKNLREELFLNREDVQDNLTSAISTGIIKFLEVKQSHGVIEK
jgi:N-acetylmuramoyl-L-alanine amidase